MDDSSDDEEGAAPAPAKIAPKDPMLQVAKNDRVFIHHDKEASQHILVRPSDFMTSVIPKIQDPVLHIMGPDGDGKFMVIVDSASKDPTTKSKYAHAILQGRRAVPASGAIHQLCVECL